MRKDFAFLWILRCESVLVARKRREGFSLFVTTCPSFPRERWRFLLYSCYAAGSLFNCLPIFADHTAVWLVHCDRLRSLLHFHEAWLVRHKIPNDGVWEAVDSLLRPTSVVHFLDLAYVGLRLGSRR